MSTLQVTNIQATGETASRAVSGVAAAWVNFNGTGTIATRGSLNVASLTDNGTGDYTINFSNNMANSNSSAMVACGDNDGNLSKRDEEVYQISTSLIKLFIYHTNTESARDEGYVGSVVNGDLA